MATFGPQPQIETSIDKVPVIPMTSEQIAHLHAQVDEARALLLPQLHDKKDLHNRMFIMALDGTQNDAINDIAHITNIGLVAKGIEDKYGKDGKVYVGYEPGVGNQKFIAGVVDSAVGYSVPQQAKSAYDKFVKVANQWHQTDPDVRISMTGIGFSRGSSALMIASNMVHEKGIPDLASAITKQVVDATTGQSHTETSYSSYIVPPGQVPQALILNEQVATGKAEAMDRRVAPSVVSVVQLQAENEQRALFHFFSAEDPSKSDPRFHTLSIVGAHSDIGGGYLLNGISSVTRQMNEIILNKFGAGIPESVPETEPKKYVIHDSEYLWDDRNAGSPTPPMESRRPRPVIYDKGPGDGLENPMADGSLLQKHQSRIEAVPEKLSMQESILAGLTQEQRVIVLARIQENLANMVGLKHENTVDERMELGR